MAERITYSNTYHRILCTSDGWVVVHRDEQMAESTPFLAKEWSLEEDGGLHVFTLSSNHQLDQATTIDSSVSTCQ